MHGQLAGYRQNTGVAPGFIDMLGQSELNILVAPSLPSKIYQGITTPHPHPRACGTFPQIIQKYVGQQHVLTLSHAIRKFTSLPAQRMGLTQRGVIKVGMYADIVVFDPARVRDTATYERPNQLAQGMNYVIVNGVPVIADGKMTYALPGKVLRGPGYVPGN